MRKTRNEALRSADLCPFGDMGSASPVANSPTSTTTGSGRSGLGRHQLGGLRQINSAGCCEPTSNFAEFASPIYTNTHDLLCCFTHNQQCVCLRKVVRLSKAMTIESPNTQTLM